MEIKRKRLKITTMEAHPWETVTGWKRSEQTLTSSVQDNQVEIEGQRYQIIPTTDLSKLEATQINQSFLLGDVPPEEIIGLVWDMSPTKFEAFALLSGL